MVREAGSEAAGSKGSREVGSGVIKAGSEAVRQRGKKRGKHGSRERRTGSKGGREAGVLYIHGHGW